MLQGGLDDWKEPSEDVHDTELGIGLICVLNTKCIMLAPLENPVSVRYLAV
jgi:hypothetical protein